MTFDDYLTELRAERAVARSHAWFCIIEDRDHWLDLGRPCAPMVRRPGFDWRGLPIVRMQARRGGPC